MERRNSAWNNRILTVLAAVFVIALSLFSIQKAFVSAVALEQTARCGLQEHRHGADCFENGVFRCTLQGHTHNRNCYLILLKDNDINVLLSEVGNDRSRNLEELIRRTVGAAMQSGESAVIDPDGVTQISLAGRMETVLLSQAQTQPISGTSLSVEPVTAQTVDIAVLNAAISSDAAQPSLVLNEDLYRADTASAVPGDTTVLSLSANSGQVSVLSVGDTPETGTYNANFYVYLDNRWQCIGTLDFSVVRSNSRYTARVATASIVGLIEDALAIDLTSDDFEMVYATSENAGNWTAVGTNGSYTTFGTNYYQQNTARQAKYIRIVDGDGDALAFYTVTFTHSDGSVDMYYVPSGTQISMPVGSDWSAGGSTYSAGEQVLITGTMSFVAVEQVADGSMRVAYDVNFPTSAGSFSNTVYMPTSPTLAATAVTTIRDTVEEFGSAVVRDLSAREVAAETAHQAGFFYVFCFAGWQTETGELIDPSSNLNWEDLQSYDADGNGIVDLEGSWLHSKATMANFCVRYDSKTGQSDTSSSKYTDSIYGAYVGGGGNLSLEGISDSDAYTVDQQIRALYGSWAGDVWLYSFPSDDYVFEQLKNYTDKLTVEDEEVNAADLNSTQYAIRWYKIFKDSADGWHIDGRLVRKKGQITVDKAFFGAADTVRQAKDGFYITATNADATKQYVLVLDEAAKNELQGTYPNAEFIVSNTGQWLIEDVEFGEVWNITEQPVSVPGSMYYAEYSSYDTDGNTTAIAEYGTTATVVGKTFALDEDPDQGMLVDFRNYYYPTESILIKKEDADTGQPIGNAAFELWQYNSDDVLVQLKFSYDSDTGQYRYDNNGSITRITTGTEGYTTITTTGFSYEHGPVVVKEVISPTGYAAAPNVTLAQSGTNIAITAMAYENGTVVEQSRWNDYAEVYDDGSALIIKNHSTALTAVTVNKVWADSASAESVTIVLQANDTTATNLFPGLANVRAELNAANGWTYTWSALPTYANGVPVVWSVKEILVGSETTTSDNVSFANWTVVYSQPIRIDTDGDGITDHWSYTVTNSVRRAQLYLVKTNPDGDALSGASFTLVEVDAAGNPVSGAITHTGTTGSDGLLLFDNLKYTTRYRLIETGPPGGYEAYTEPAYLTLAADGTVTVEDHSHVYSANRAYVVRVVNYAPLPLPMTGGIGPAGLYRLGGALMLLAACGYILLNHERKRRRQSG